LTAPVVLLNIAPAAAKNDLRQKGNQGPKMKIEVCRYQGRRGFTMPETLGVLAVIMLLVSLLIPKVLNAIKDAKLVADVQSIKAMSDATWTYFQKYGKLASTNGAGIAAWDHSAFENWDRLVLLKEQIISTPLFCNLAPTSYIRLVQVSITTSNTDILSAPGQRGHLPSFNSNNGYYNLTREYALNSTPGSDALMYALHHRSVSTSPFLSATMGGGLSPLFACYPVPTGWTVPPPGVGSGTTGGGTVSYSNPGADSQIVAKSSSSPVIVAEVVLEGVTVADAYRLSVAIDGRKQSNWAYYDALGRVKYDMYDGSGGTKTGVVFIYLGSK
jgi:type II secretory pathway pseudopilin PulG